MKNLLVLAMIIVSSSAFAEHHMKDDAAHKAAAEACKEHKDKKALDACIAEKTKAPAPAAEMKPAK